MSSSVAHTTPETAPVESARSPSQVRFPLIVSLFVLSGATGLVDQLCFSKYLSTVVGSTAYAVSAVLAAFMTGLAIGAHWGGKISERVRRPLLTYGVMEVVVAVAVAISPLLFGLLTPMYVSLARGAGSSLPLVSALRWLAAMLLVIVPTIAMGTTLPLLARALPTLEAGLDDRDREKRLGALYAANTLGGALGALLAAYFIVPALGLTVTLLASAAASATIGLAAWWLGRNAEPVARRAPRVREAEEVSSEETGTKDFTAGDTSQPTSRELLLLTGLAFLSGWLVFAAEIVFTHLLALIIGNSAYAFGLILAIFLLCLFFGASRAAWFQHKFGDAALPYGLALAGLALVSTLAVWDKLPFLFAGAGETVTSFAGREGLRALAAFLALFVPTTLMGLTFPLLLQRVARFTSVGALVGRLTAVNTLGAVVGSLVTGYALLPSLGSQRTLSVVGLLLVAAGLLTPRSSGGRSKAVVGYVSAAALAIAVFTPRWDLAHLTKGTNVYFDGGQASGQVVFLKEDVHGGVTSVMMHKGVTTLYTNGKFQGNNGWEMNAQRFFAHYPCLFVKKFDELLVIGLGTGTTLGTFSAYPWKTMDLVEISPSIVEAAGTYFTGPNRNALHDPRLTIHLQDGRNHLLIDEKRYDLISMELSSIWFAGAASLYSKEFYAIAKRRLKPGGVFQQWVQLHHIRREDFATILHTLRINFNHVSLFLGGGQGILVASDDPLIASRARLAEIQSRSEIHDTVPHERPLPDLFRDLLVMDGGLDRFLKESADVARVPLDELVSTDDNLYLEYATPRGNVLPWSSRDVLIAQLARHRDGPGIARMLHP